MSISKLRLDYFFLIKFDLSVNSFFYILKGKFVVGSADLSTLSFCTFSKHYLSIKMISKFLY